MKSEDMLIFSCYMNDFTVVRACDIGIEGHLCTLHGSHACLLLSVHSRFQPVVPAIRRARNLARAVEASGIPHGREEGEIRTAPDGPRTVAYSCPPSRWYLLYTGLLHLIVGTFYPPRLLSFFSCDAKVFVYWPAPPDRRLFSSSPPACLISRVIPKCLCACFSPSSIMLSSGKMTVEMVPVGNVYFAPRFLVENPYSRYGGSIRSCE